MTLPETLLNFLHSRSSERQGNGFTITSVTPLSGGSINSVFKLYTNDVPLVLKLNGRDQYPGMFEAEAKGLALLRKPGAIAVPEVVDQGDFEDHTFLLLEYVEPGIKSSTFWENFGESLASLHRESADYFGLDHDNYIGSLPQQNTRVQSWNEFFAVYRLEAQLKKAYDSGFFRGSGKSKFQKLISRLPDLIPEEPPALLHGDLWGGNYLVNEKNQPVLIDPAVYYGHREMDLAMMHLFGGFDQEIFQHYHRHFPLESGWKKRIDLHNLYPLLVHVNLFGGSYEQQVIRALNKFT